jgi:hypothetical protein
MKADEIKDLPNGLYIIIWVTSEGGGFSLSALGRDREGKIWIAPVNWTSGSTSIDEQLDKIENMLLVMDKSDVLRKICPHKNSSFRNSAIMRCADCGAEWQE